MRVSLLTGEVKLKRHDNPDWERAQLNFPIVEGDTLSTATDSRLEIQAPQTHSRWPKLNSANRDAA